MPCMYEQESFIRLSQTHQIFMRKIQKKYLFNMYVKIKGSLQPNFTKFNADFLAKYNIQSSEEKSFLNTDKRGEKAWLPLYSQPTCLYLQIRGRTPARITLRLYILEKNRPDLYKL